MLSTDIKIYLIALGFSSLIGLWKFHVLRTAWKMMVVILVFTSVTEVLGHTIELPVERIHLLYQIYTPLSFGLYILVFLYLFAEPLNQRIAVVFLLLILAAGIGLPMMNSIRDFPSLTIAACSLILIITSLLMFRELIRMPESLAISKNPRFLLSASVLIYWGLFFFRHGLYNTLIREQNGYTIWLDDLHLWISVLYYLTLLYCVLISAKTVSKSKE